jgi:hypothetical protein
MIFFRRLSFQPHFPKGREARRIPACSADYTVGTDPALNPSPAAPAQGNEVKKYGLSDEPFEEPSHA